MCGASSSYSACAMTSLSANIWLSMLYARSMNLASFRRSFSTHCPVTFERNRRRCSSGQSSSARNHSARTVTLSERIGLPLVHGFLSRTFFAWPGLLSWRSPRRFDRAFASDSFSTSSCISISVFGPPTSHLFSGDLVASTCFVFFFAHRIM